MLTPGVSKWLVLLAILVFNGPPANASPVSGTDNRLTVFDLFYGEEVLDVTLETDLVRLMENIKTENYQSAIFSFDNKQGETLSFQAEIRPRGNFRRRVCDFPPIMIKFSKEKLVGADIKPHNKLKLVTHCLDDRNAGQENLLKEYLAYKLYQELTNQSYRVQLVRINYEDTKGKLSRIKRYAIILEDTDEMAERLGGEECDCLNPQKEQLDQRLEGIHALYQYMIGNEDWSISMNRNLKMVKPLNGQSWKPVPYDFDFSGLVNASYAIPNTQLGLKSIQDRLYLGMPIADTELEYLFSYFRSKKDALLQIVEDCKSLSRSGRNEVIDYLESFYTKIDQLETEVGTNLYQAMSSNSIPLDSDKKGMNSGK
jgi:hypothetical protein